MSTRERQERVRSLRFEALAAAIARAAPGRYRFLPYKRGRLSLTTRVLYCTPDDQPWATTYQGDPRLIIQVLGPAGVVGDAFYANLNDPRPEVRPVHLYQKSWWPIHNGE